MLSSYIDGEVDSAELREVEEHLAACDSCRRDLDSLRFTVGLLQELPEVSVRRSFSLSEAPGPIRTGPSPGWAAGLATSMAALLLVALLLGDITGVLVQTPGLEMDGLAARATTPFLAAPPEVSDDEREAVVSEVVGPVAPTAPAPLPAPAMAASAPALPATQEAPGTEVAKQTDSEKPPAEPRSLTAPAPSVAVQQPPAAPEPSRQSAPIDAAAQQDGGVIAAAPESLPVPSAPEALKTPKSTSGEERESPLAASAPAREAPDEDGLALPLWQLEAVVLAIVLALVALWAILKRRAVSRI